MEFGILIKTNKGGHGRTTSECQSSRKATSKIIEIKKYSGLKQKCNKFGVEQPLIKEKVD